jgi:hypothetical protein
MSNVTPIGSDGESSGRNTDAEPAWPARVTGFSSVEVYYTAYEDLPPSLEYCGRAEDLIASGAATDAMLVINPPRGPRVRRVDQEGDPFRILRYWRSGEGGSECPPYRWYRLTRIKPLERLERLPGAQEAIATRTTWDEWFERRRRADQEPSGPGRPVLRLVIDNTRSEP